MKNFASLVLLLLVITANAQVTTPADMTDRAGRALVAITAPNLTEITNNIVGTLNTLSSNNGLLSAYEPSWTMLIGEPTQNLLPHKFSAVGLNFTFLQGGTVRIDTTEAVYSCVHEYMGGRNGYSRYNCNYNGQRPVSFTMSAASGRGSTVRVISGTSYGGNNIIYSPNDDSGGGLPGFYYKITLSPVVSSTGALTGFSFNTNDDDFFYGTYNNPTMTPITGVTNSAYYFCDPQNACGVYRGTFPASN